MWSSEKKITKISEAGLTIHKTSRKHYKTHPRAERSDSIFFGVDLPFFVVAILRKVDLHFVCKPLIVYI